MNSLRECLRTAAGARATWQRFYIGSQRQLATQSLYDVDRKTLLIIGRPNVGKSTLFNRLIGRRNALVHDTPSSHVTRDYKEGLARFSDLQFRIIDTSGLEPAMSAETVQGRATRITKQVSPSCPIPLTYTCTHSFKYKSHATPWLCTCLHASCNELHVFLIYGIAALNRSACFTRPGRNAMTKAL